MRDDFWTWFTYRRFGFREVIVMGLLAQLLKSLIGVLNV